MHININISHTLELSNDDRWQFRLWILPRRYKLSNYVDWMGCSNVIIDRSVGTNHKKTDCDLLVEAETKWLQFLKWFIQTHFLQWKYFYFDEILTEICFASPFKNNRLLVKNGTVPIRRQAIICSNDYMINLVKVKMRNVNHALATAPILDSEQLFLNQSNFYEVKNSTLLVGLELKFTYA